MVNSQRAGGRIVRVSCRPLNIPLLEPFAIATGTVHAASNVLVEVELDSGIVGLGECAPFPPSGGETQETAIAAITGMESLLVGRTVQEWRSLASLLLANFEHQEVARAGVEIALFDAFARTLRVPMHYLFGGASRRVETDITIPINSVDHMTQLAAEHVASGARTLKLKVGTQRDLDIERVMSVAAAAPRCALILDGNQGFSPSDAVYIIRQLANHGVYPVLFEQPVHRHDLTGLRFVTEHAGVPVAADEAVHTAADAQRIISMGAANVINIKLMKSGIVEALDIAAVCRASHTELMIGAMMESRLAISTAAHFIAGLGGFRYVDLDTPMLLAEDPFEGGYTQQGMSYELSETAAGHGVTFAPMASIRSASCTIRPSSVAIGEPLKLLKDMWVMISTMWSQSGLAISRAIIHPVTSSRARAGSLTTLSSIMSWRSAAR